MSETRLFAVVGRPVRHSRSPQIHAAAFRMAGLDGRYVRLAAESAADAFRVAGEIGLAGFNVTAPFKEEAARLADKRTEAVSATGAANTLARRKNRWVADNTDVAGVNRALSAAGVEAAGARALVVGAGGAGRAAAWALREAEADRVTIVNRTDERAARAAADLRCLAAPFADLETAVRAADIIVSCVSAEATPIRGEWLRGRQVVLDANYRDGALQRVAASRGCRVVDGAMWLVHQAAAAFEMFTGQGAPVGAMVEAVAVAEARRGAGVSLIGFMGAGKSVVGRWLAEELGLTFVDTDAEIERRTGRTIPEIFAAEGEAAFRRREAAVVAETADRADAVIAYGGGAVLDPANAAAMATTRTVVWLWSTAAEGVRRMAPGSRPLLAGADAATRAAALLNERLPAYAAAADLVVENPPGDPRLAVATIRRELTGSEG